MKRKQRNCQNTYGTIGLSLILILSLILSAPGVPKKAEAAVILMEPEIVQDTSMDAGQKVTYDCIWFGSYPQREIVDYPSSCGTYGRSGVEWASDADYEWNPDLYEKLVQATDWDENGDITLDNKVRYHRIRKTDATYYSSSTTHYLWQDSDTYHYFRYEPIKWRILSLSGNQALLLSDLVLDNQNFHTTLEDVNWGTSTLRSWLNGYGSGDNSVGQDYTADNFLNRAFDEEEQQKIISSSLINEDNSLYGTEGGEDTQDKVFLLSEADTYFSEESEAYGFSSDYAKADEARRRKSSTYAKAMGIWVNNTEQFSGNVCWWLRTPGKTLNYLPNVQIMNTKQDGSLNIGGSMVNPSYLSLFSTGSSNSKGSGTYVGGVCPAIRMELSSQTLWKYAGTVSTDGSQNQQDHGLDLGSDTALYSVIYNANGGTGAPSTDTKTYGKDLILSDTVPTREGYLFKGWARTADSSVAEFQPGDSYTENAMLRLYAVWDKIISKKKQTITAAGKNIPVNSNPIPLGATTDGDGKLSYSSSAQSVAAISSTGLITPKKYGKTTITIRASETATYQSASRNITISIVPKKMTITSLKSPAKKAALLRWKKDKTVTGYEVQLCLKKKFNAGVLKRRYKKTITKARIKNLKRKTWYIRIRAYKKVGGKIYSGNWSKVKKIKVK